MAQYEHLPIYKKTVDLTIYIENIVRGFSRYHKYTLGTDLRNLSREVVRLIIRANSERDRLATLTLLRDAVEELKVCMRICKEVKAFKNFNSFTHGIEEVVSLSRQSEGWILKDCLIKGCPLSSFGRPADISAGYKSACR